MKPFYFLLTLVLCFLFLGAPSAVAQVAGDYRSAVATGNWSANTSWETYDGSVWSAATTPPTATANVTIQNLHNITLDASQTIATLTISSGGILTFANAVTLSATSTTVAAGGTVSANALFTWSGDITVNGLFNGAGSTVTTNGNITVTGSAAKWAFGSNGGNITCNTAGKTFTLSNGATLQTTSNTTDPVGNTFKGTNPLTFVVDNSAALTTITLKFSGNMSVTSLPNGQQYGHLSFTTASASVGRTITLATSVSLLGNLTFAPVATAGGTNTWLFGANTISSSGGTVTVTSVSNLCRTKITGTGTDLFSGFSSYNFVAPSNGNCVVEYASAGAQNVVPGTYQVMAISGGGAKTLSGDATVTDTLTLTSGVISTGANTLTASGTVSGASSASYVDGKLARVYRAAGSRDFAIGAGGNYRPLTLNYAALTGTSTVTAQQTETSLSGTIPTGVTLFSARKWTVSQSGGSGIRYSIALDGTGFTPTGTPVILKNESGTISTYLAVASAPTYTAAELTSFGDFALGDYTGGAIILVNAALTPFTSAAGVPSPEQSYTVAGAALSGNITITAPTDFELSLTSGSGFSTSPIVLTQSGGTVGTTRIFVRMNRPTAGNPSGNITHTSSGATQQNVAVSGTVGALVPTITVTGTLSPFSSAGGIPSAEQTYSVSGSNLISDILITAPTDFQVSTTGGGAGFGSSVTLTQSGGTVNSTTIYVRMYRPTAGTPSGNITHTSTSATQKNQAVSGTVTAPPTITSTTTGGPWSAPATWVGGVVPWTANPVVIADGATVTIDADVSVPSLTVGQGVSGTLKLDSLTARAVAVSGNITVSTGASFLAPSAGTVNTHTLAIGGNLVNNGTFNMDQAGSSARYCNVTFNKAGDQTISGTGTTTQFRGITLDKGSVSNRVLSSIRVSQYGAGIFQFTTGTWEQTADTLIVWNGSQTIGATGALVISGAGSLTMPISSGDLQVYGTLTVNTSGKLTFGPGSAQISAVASTSVVNFLAGTVNINGRFAATSGAAVTIDGASVNIDPQLLAGTQNPFAISTGTGTGATLTFTSGTITILNPIVGTGTLGGREFQITTGGAVNISGTATLVLGQGAGTLSAPNDFRINCSQGNSLQNLVINVGANTVKSVAPHLIVKGTLTLTSGTLSIGAQIIDGVTANQITTLDLYNPIAGTAANLQQALSSTGGPLSSVGILGTASGINIPSQINRLRALTINNLSGTTLQGNLQVDTTFTLTSGALNLNAKTLVYDPHLTLVYNGLSAQTTSSVEFPASGGPGSLTINNAAGVVLHASRTINDTIRILSGSLTFANPADKITLNGGIVEAAGSTVVGTVQTTRTVGLATLEKFGLIGMDINAAGAAPGVTTVTRVTGVTSSAGSGSIKRYFDISPTTNTGLNATLVFHYDDSELNSLTEGDLLLFKSTNAGSTWTSMGFEISNMTANWIGISGVNDLSRWTAGVTTSTTTLSVALASGWNLISNPVTNPVPNDSVKQLFPTSLNAYAFEYSGGYVQRYQLANGKGYWGKFPAAISNSITGTPRTRDSVAVVSGWNIVGSISNTVDTNTIVSVPPGLRASAWFGYLGGYAAVTQLVPGKGYWVKSNGTGKFVLANPLGKVSAGANGPALADVLNTLTITDSRGGSQTLYFGGDAEGQAPVSMYAMPPLPPVGGFDARFSGAEGGTMVQRHAAKVSGPVEFPVEIQSEAYPVTVSWKVTKGAASYELTDGRGGKAFRSREMVGEGSVKLTNSELNKITVRLVGDGQLPAEFALSQNFPNPFNPTTNIKYALPVESRVTMEIYNVLGQRVRTLVSENVAAGYHIAEWNAVGDQGQQLGSGTYFLKLSATGVNGATFSEVRKLMMLK